MESDNGCDGERVNLRNGERVETRMAGSGRHGTQRDGYAEDADTRYYITFELAIGGELFDRITQRGRFTEKDAVECIRYVPLFPVMILLRVDVSFEV